jgi:glycosyl transferase family 87
MTATGALLGPGTRATAAIRLVLAALVVLVSVASAIRLVTTTPVAIDLLIPLRAASRWLDGGVAYLPEGFTDPGALPPFLYPPFVLPLVAPLTALPELALRWAWVLGTLAVGWWSFRWLGLGLVPATLALAWIPMAEGIWTGNVSVVIFLAFVAAFWHRARGRAGAPARPRQLDIPGETGPHVGFLAASLAALKPSQVHGWLAVLRRQPRSAGLGVVPWVAVVLVTLPLVGVGAYVDWIGQVRLAADPQWPMMGVSLLAYLPAIVFGALVAGSLVAAWLLRGPDTGAWLGILMFLVTPNMHSFNGLFLVPAMLLIRREFALVAAMLMATYSAEGWWLGAAIVIATMLIGTRLPVARESQGVSAPSLNARGRGPTGAPD